jgi:hypothetical protein
MGEVNTALEKMIVEGRYLDAIKHVAPFNVSYVSSMITIEAVETAPENFDKFIREYYESLQSSFMRAEVAYELGGLYLTALSYLDQAFFIYRDISLDALTCICKQAAYGIGILDVLVGCPDKVIPPQSFSRFMNYKSELESMIFQFAERELTQHEGHMKAELEELEEDFESWSVALRKRQIEPLTLRSLE